MVASTIKPNFMSRDKNEERSEHEGTDQLTKSRLTNANQNPEYTTIRRSDFAVLRYYLCKADGPKLHIA